MVRGLSKTIEAVGTTSVTLAELSQRQALTTLNLFCVVFIPLFVFGTVFITLNIWKQAIIHPEGSKSRVHLVREFFSRDVFLYACNLGSLVQCAFVLFAAYQESSSVLLASALLDVFFDAEGLWENWRYMMVNPNIKGHLIGKMSERYDTFVTKGKDGKEVLPNLTKDDSNLLDWEGIEAGDMLSHLPRILEEDHWMRIYTEDGPYYMPSVVALSCFWDLSFYRHVYSSLLPFVFGYSAKKKLFFEGRGEDAFEAVTQFTGECI